MQPILIYVKLYMTPLHPGYLCFIFSSYFWVNLLIPLMFVSMCARIPK